MEKVNVRPSFQSDHSIVELTLQFEIFARGPGYWKLNTALLRDTDYVEKMNNLLEIELALNSELKYKSKWELIKLAINGSSIQYASRKKKANANKGVALKKKLHSLYLELQNKNPLAFDDTCEQIRLVKHELRELNAIKTKGAMIRSRSNWINKADAPTKYFLNLEKKNFQKKTLYRIQNSEGVILTDETQILQEIRQFYLDLYTSKGSIDATYLDKLQIPKIPDELKIELDAPITLDEIAIALADFPNNKCPSTDGLPAEFYKVFFPKIKNFSLNCIKR